MASPSASATETAVTLPEIPDGFTLHTENSAHILLPGTDEAFLNPVQEFNRDLSVACIRVWSEELDALRERKWRERAEKKGKGPGKGNKKKKSEWILGLSWCLFC